MASSDIAVNEELLETKLTALEAARTWGPRVVSKLENTIRTGSDDDVFRINPIRYGVDRNIEAPEAVDLFIHAAHLGLLEMRWTMVCRRCASVFASFEHLSSVHPDFVCTVCKNENEVTLDDSIHITFTVSHQIRDIVYNHPESLSAEDYYFKYYLAEGSTYPPDTPFESILRHSARVVEYLQPRSTYNYELNLDPGALLVRSVDTGTAAMFLINPAVDTGTSPHNGADGEPPRQKLQLRYGPDSLSTTNPGVAPANVDLDGLSFLADLAGELHPGPLDIEISNDADRRSSVIVLAIPPVNPKTLSFAPFLSGRQLLTVQTFRDLFRSEAVDATEGIAVENVTLLFTDVTGSTALYDRIGDAQAFFLVQKHFDTLQKAVTDNRGAVVKTIGDAVMAAFMTPANAVSAALQSLEGIDAFNKTIREDIVIRIGIHCGHCIVITSNGRPDYFGQTVNIAARVQGLAGAGEICISEAVFNADGVGAVIGDREVTDQEVQAKGVGKSLHVYALAAS